MKLWSDNENRVSLEWKMLATSMIDVIKVTHAQQFFPSSLGIIGISLVARGLVFISGNPCLLLLLQRPYSLQKFLLRFFISLPMISALFQSTNTLNCRTRFVDSGFKATLMKIGRRLCKSQLSFQRPLKVPFLSLKCHCPLIFCPRHFLAVLHLRVKTS